MKLPVPVVSHKLCSKLLDIDVVIHFTMIKTNTLPETPRGASLGSIHSPRKDWEALSGISLKSRAKTNTDTFNNDQT